MALDPQAKAFVEKANATPQPPPGEVPLKDFRAAMGAFAPLGFDREELAQVTDLTVAAPGAPEVRVRVYRPEPADGQPIVVWAHGGSWVRCDLDTHDAFLRVVANRSRCVVVSVDYRLSPESRFPQALHEVHAASQWTRENAADLGGDPDRLAIGGDSSGANIAAAVTLLARAEGDLAFAHQTLLLPVLDLTFESPSWSEFGEGYVLTRDQLDWAAEQYAPGADRTDQLLSPLLAEDHAGLPPALIVTAEYDPLRDEGERYGQALEGAGVVARHVRYAGMIHHAPLVPKAINLGRRAVEETAGAMGAALDGAVKR